MGASFRNTLEITELAGCDRLTISPQLLRELEDNADPSFTLQRKLSPEETSDLNIERVENLDETKFRWELNEDAMATEKLAEGIRKFAQDLRSLEQFVEKKLQESN